MKKRKSFQLISALVVLVLLIGAYVGVTLLTKGEEDTAEEEDKKIEISKVDREEITQIQFKNNKADITLELNGETWNLAGDKAYPINQYKVSAMLDAIAEVTSERELTGDEIDRKEFGLDALTTDINFKKKDGTSVHYGIAALNNLVNQYYFTVDDKTSVYMIDTTMYNAFDMDLLTLTQMEEYPVLGGQDIVDFTLTKGKKVIYYKDKAEAANKKDTSEIPECEWYVGTSKNDLKKADKDTASNLVQAMLSLTNSSCAAYRPSEKELSKYGLDNPKLELFINYTESHLEGTKEEAEGEEESTPVPNAKTIIDKKSLRVYFGKKTEFGEYYVRIEGSDAIYTMNEGGAKLFFEAFDKK